MPTSGDLKSGHSLFCITPPPLPPPNVNSPNIPHPPCPQNDEVAMAKDIIMKSYMKYLTKKSLSESKYGQKCPRNRTMNKKSLNCEKKELNFKPKHRKAQKSILCERFGDPNGRAGDLCPVW